MRLLYFDLTQGNRIAAQFAAREFGWQKASMILAKLKWRQTFDNPFKEINRKKKPTRKQKLSQRQMAPLVILYQVLQEFGYSKEDALKYCEDISREVAIAFLKYNVPPFRKSDFSGKPRQEKMNAIARITKRFFNAETTADIGEGDKLSIDIHTCYFAAYSMQLGVPELGPLFCATDQFYFDHFQKEVKFTRTQTLAEHRKPCDFRFEWNDEGTA